jgi:hypothetical protein
VGNERNATVTAQRLRAAKPSLVVEERGVRTRCDDPRLILPEDVFAVLLLWDAAELGPGSWIGWITTVNHRSACFCAADLHHDGFCAWLARLPGWEPARLTCAIDTPGLHLVWRRHVD